MITESDFKLDSSRLTFYHDKFKYKMSVKIRGIYLFRFVKSMAEFNKKLNYYHNNKMYYSDVISIIDDAEYLLIIQKFVKCRSSIIEKNLDFKLRIGDTNITIYSNDFTVFELIIKGLNYSKDDKLITYYYVEPMMNYEKGIIYQKEPKRKFRIYMKTMRYTQDQRDKLYDYLKRNDITMSPSMIKWVSSKNLGQSVSGSYQWSSSYNQYAWDHYFFDFDQESLITILSLKFDNLIRKVCTIQKR